MNKITFEFVREDLLKQIKLHAYYSGDSRKEQDDANGVYSKMQASDENDDVLDRFVDKSCSRIASIVGTLLSEVAVTAGEKVISPTTASTTIVMNVDAPVTFDGSRKPFIHECIKDYIINWSLYEWYLLVNPGEAKVCFENCGLTEVDLRKHINGRKKPIKRIIP